MRSFLYALILLLLTANAYAQSAAGIDSAVAGIQQIKDGPQRRDSLYHYVNTLIDYHPKEAIKGAATLLQDAQAQDNKEMVANANNIIAIGYEYAADYPQSLKYYLDALLIQKELKLYAAQVNTMLGVSRIYDHVGDLPNQKKYVVEAIAICEQNKTNARIIRRKARVLDYLATIYKKEGRFDTAIKIYNEAIDLARKDSNSLQERSTLCNLAIALKSNKDFRSSLIAYNKALALTDTAADPFSYAVIIDNMAILFYQSGDMGRAEQYALKAITLGEKLNITDILRDSYETLKNIYEKEKNYPQAMAYFSKWSDIKDTILNQEKAQQITDAQTRFDTQSKDKEIAEQKKEIAYNRKINLSLGVSSLLLLSLGLIVYRNFQFQKKANALISKEKKRSEDLLLNILPTEVAEELKDKGNAAARHFEHVTVMFTDFVNFTQASERMNHQQLIDELHYCFKAFDEIIGKHNIEKIKTIGDSYLAVSGLPVADNSHAEHIVSAAVEINEFVNARKKLMGDNSFEVRIGIHSGSVIAGIVGVKKFSYDIWGDTVNTAARMEQNSEAGKINISQTTYELVKDKFHCTYRGEIDAKNKGLLKMYFVSR